MMNSGEANMQMSEKTDKYPTKVCRLEGSNRVRLMATTAANTAKTPSTNPNIFNCIERV